MYLLAVSTNIRPLAPWAARAEADPILPFIDRETEQRVSELEIPFNQYGVDPYGVSRKDIARVMTISRWFYRTYFRMSVHGIEHVPPRGRTMLVGNHSGGVALDAAMVVASMFFEMDPPRLAQAMAEKFLNKVPFFSQFSNRLGHFTGLPEHAARLLEDERLLMVFPEGARGTAKLYPERHSLVQFGTGFVRLAMKTRTPIVPFAFVGGGEAIPTVVNAYALGRLFGAPYVPVTPYLFALPLPVRLSVEYAAPVLLEGTGSEDDEHIQVHVDRIKDTIAGLIAVGVERRKNAGGARVEAPREQA
ncbi:MAG: lysophospholipid acyltransferase family protein [Polyangiaceae bacterium]